jgi:hypothetical protein
MLTANTKTTTMQPKLKTASLCLLLLFAFTTKAQVNLVPNPSFEDTVKCPSTWANFPDCANWMNFGYSPEYFHACGPNGVNTPYAGFGFQYAHSGLAMAGLATWANPGHCPNCREFIGSELNSPLQIGTKYFMSFYLNNSGFPYKAPYRRVAANKIGLRFFTVGSSSLSVGPSEVNLTPVNNVAHLYTDSIYKDTVNWVKLSGSFIADSAYKFLIIGNFFDDANTDTSSYPGPIMGGMGAYYFIDDVCVTTDSIYNEHWAEDIIGIGKLQHSKPKKFTFYPNPATDRLYFSNSGASAKSTIYISNHLGTMLKKQEIKSGDYIDISDLESGAYFIRIASSEYTETKKIMINKK